MTVARLGFPARCRMARNGEFRPCKYPISIRLADGDLHAVSLKDAKQPLHDLTTAIRTVEDISSIVVQPAGDASEHKPDNNGDNDDASHTFGP